MSKNLRPSIVRTTKEQLFSNLLKEKVVVAPLNEFQNSCDVVFEKEDELKAYKLFYILTKNHHVCNEMRVFESPVNGKIYLIITYENNITECE